MPPAVPRPPCRADASCWLVLVHAAAARANSPQARLQCMHAGSRRAQWSGRPWRDSASPCGAGALASSGRCRMRSHVAPPPRDTWLFCVSLPHIASAHQALQHTGLDAERRRTAARPLTLPQPSATRAADPRGALGPGCGPRAARARGWGVGGGRRIGASKPCPQTWLPAALGQPTAARLRVPTMRRRSDIASRPDARRPPPCTPAARAAAGSPHRTARAHPAMPPRLRLAAVALLAAMALAGLPAALAARLEPAGDVGAAAPVPPAAAGGGAALAAAAMLSLMLLLALVALVGIKQQEQQPRKGGGRGKKARAATNGSASSGGDADGLTAPLLAAEVGAGRMGWHPAWRGRLCGQRGWHACTDAMSAAASPRWAAGGEQHRGAQPRARRGASCCARPRDCRGRGGGARPAGLLLLHCCRHCRHPLCRAHRRCACAVPHLFCSASGSLAMLHARFRAPLHISLTSHSPARLLAPPQVSPRRARRERSAWRSPPQAPPRCSRPASSR